VPGWEPLPGKLPEAADTLAGEQRSVDSSGLPRERSTGSTKPTQTMPGMRMRIGPA